MTIKESVRIRAALVAAVIAFVTSGCSGGGGTAPGPMGTSTGPGAATPLPSATIGSAATPPPTPSTPAPTPTAKVAPTAPPVTLTGQVVNHDAGAALPGAVVYISHALVSGATAPMTAPADGGEVMTDASGNYAMTLPAQAKYPARLYLEAFTPGMVTVHAVLTVAQGGPFAAPTFGETTLASDEANWLVLINQDRAKWNAAPVVADETTEEVARLWVGFLGQGHYEHNCSSGDVNCPDKVAFEAAEFADYTATGENIAQGESSYANAERDFMAESANCPQPVDPQTCPESEITGHFINIVNQTAVWFGMAEDLNGVGSNNLARPSYDEELAYPNLSYGNTIAVRVRRDSYRLLVPLS